MENLKRTFLFSISILLVLSLVSGITVQPLAQNQGKRDTLRVAVASWTSAMAISEVVEYLVENEIGFDVEPTDVNLGAAFIGLENKDLDILIEGWLPTAQKEYWKQSSNDLLTFGPVYENAKQGWVVPEYIPKEKLSKIEDLKKEEVRKKLDSEIIGISPGTGVMEHSSEMIEEYGLKHYSLVAGSDPAMLASLKRAIQREEWIVVTLWQPHVAFADYDLRFLNEPKNLQGTEEGIYTVVRKDILTALPSEVTQFLARMHMPVSLANELVSMYDEHEGEVGKVFAEKYPNLVNYWVNGMESL